MKIRQHVPGFIEGHVAKRAEVETLAELLELDQVKSWRMNYIEGPLDIPFWRFSKAQAFKTSKEWMLMAEWKDNKDHKWRVIGYLDTDVDLPVWRYEETLNYNKEKK